MAGRVRVSVAARSHSTPGVHAGSLTPMRVPTAFLFLAALLFVGPAAVARPDRATVLRREFEGRKRKVLVEAAQEHLRVGSWARDAGLVAQSTAEFLRAVDVAEGRHPGAIKVLAIMQRLDDKFWKKNLKKPSAGMIRAYDKRARKARRMLEVERLKLAAWALKKKELQKEAYQEYRAILARSGSSMEPDAKGRLVLEFGTIPAELTTRLLEEAVTIDERRYVRDSFLQHVPDLTGLHEAASEDLRVRTSRSADTAAWILDACHALLPFLEQDTGGRPTQRLDIYAFATREDFATYLDAVGMSEFNVASGLADGGRRTVIVCGEGLDDTILLGMVFHELAHLFQYAVTPVRMPSWYAEGFAETWGGTGTYAWDGETLEAGGLMRSDRLDELKTDEGFIPLAELVDARALHLLSTSRGRGLRFYAESWAFYRYMKRVAPKAHREAFREWELKCKGAALGAEPGKHYVRNTKPAAALFHEVFDENLAEIEVGFRAWLQTL